jgi:hypothetical protein
LSNKRNVYTRRNPEKNKEETGLTVTTETPVSGQKAQQIDPEGGVMS